MTLAHIAEKEKRDKGIPSEVYGQWAHRMGPQVRDALAGKIKISPQTPWAEAWIALALYWGKAQLSLEGILQYADLVNHSIPNAEEIAWALLMLRKRHWLSEHENLYGLTADGRRALEGVVDKGNLRKTIERVDGWISAHPVPRTD